MSILLQNYKNLKEKNDEEFLLKIALCATALLAVGGVATHRTFYIKGCTFDHSFSHTRVGLMTKTGALINTAPLSDWFTAVTMTQLDEDYYSISIAPSYVNSNGAPYYFYFSASGTGDNVIVSHTPIE